MKRRKVISALTATIALGGMAACTAVPHGGQRDALLRRVRSYWDLSKTNDNVTAWAFEDVSLDPRWTLQAYLSRGSAVYDEVVVRDIVSMTDDEAEVQLEVTFSLPALRIKRHTMTILDKWRLINDNWYHVLQTDSMFRKPQR